MLREDDLQVTEGFCCCCSTIASHNKISQDTFQKETGIPESKKKTKNTPAAQNTCKCRFPQCYTMLLSFMSYRSCTSISCLIQSYYSWHDTHPDPRPELHYFFNQLSKPVLLLSDNTLNTPRSVCYHM